MNSLADYEFIDIHYHANPDLFDRRYDAIKAGQIYQALNGAVFLKSHLGATSVQATLAQAMGLPVFPSLVLNAIAGGINYKVIMRALAEYQPTITAKMIVHFPTITDRPFQTKLSRQLSHHYLSPYTQKGARLFNAQHQLRQEVIDILKMAVDYPIILSTGHASKDEVYRLIDACAAKNIHALLLNQPAHPLTGLDAASLRDITSKNQFVWVEQTALTYLLGYQSQEEFAAVLKEIPRVIYSSDLGQTNQMHVENWLDYSNNIFRQLDLPTQRKSDLMRLNALKLLSIP